MRTRWILAAALTMTACTAKPPKLQPGEWEISVNVDVEQPVELFRPDAKAGNFELGNIKQSGSELSWTIEQKGRSKGWASVTLQPTTYQGTMRMEIMSEGVMARVTSSLRGHRVGECK
jgi:hypothetical protein